MKILKENNLFENAEISNLENKGSKIKKHLEKNKQDKRSIRAAAIINARIRKINKYRNRKKK